MHDTLIDGFHAILDKEALGWAVLDCKSELLVTATIAAAINRKAGQRMAHIEFARSDLVILSNPLPAVARRNLGYRATPQIRMTLRGEGRALL